MNVLMPSDPLRIEAGLGLCILSFNRSLIAEDSCMTTDDDCAVMLDKLTLTLILKLAKVLGVSEVVWMNVSIATPVFGTCRKLRYPCIYTHTTRNKKYIYIYFCLLRRDTLLTFM